LLCSSNSLTCNKNPASAGFFNWVNQYQNK